MNTPQERTKKCFSREQILNLKDTSSDLSQDVVSKLKKLGIYKEGTPEKSTAPKTESIALKSQRRNSKKNSSHSLETTSPISNTSTTTPVSISRKNSKGNKPFYRFVEASHQGQQEEFTSEMKRLDFERELEEQRKQRQKHTSSPASTKESIKISTSPLQQILDNEMKKETTDEATEFINQIYTNYTKHRSNSKARFEEYIEKSTCTIAGDWSSEEELLVFPLLEDEEDENALLNKKSLRHSTESFEEDSLWIAKQSTIQQPQNWTTSPPFTSQPTAGSASPPASSIKTNSTSSNHSFFQNDVPYSNSATVSKKKTVAIPPPCLIPTQSLYHQLKSQPKSHAVV